ncbi:hypothetical protein KKG81_12985 [bacterium]|nr:hypothetical protein [bacterium]
MNRNILWVLLLFCIIDVYGAEYKLNMIKDSISTEINTGESGLGSFLLYTEIEGDIYELTNITTNLNVTTRDYLKNTFDHEIKVNNMPLIVGGTYQITTTGIIEIYEYPSSTIVLYTVNVTNIPQLNVNIFRNVTDDFLLSFTPNSFKLGEVPYDEQRININSSYPIIITPQHYNLNFNINIYNLSLIEDINFTLKPLEKFNISIINCEKELPIGTHDLFCTINLTNEGNKIIDIDFSTDKYKKDFGFPQGIGLFIGQSKKVKLYYDVSTMSHTLSDNITIIAKGEKHSTNITIPVNFTDRIIPHIENFSMPNIEAVKNYEFFVELIENLELSECKAAFYKMDGGEWKYIKESILTLDRFNIYKFNVTLEEIGEYKAELRIRDRAENINITSYRFNVMELNSIIYKSNIIFNKVKYNNYMNTNFLEMTKPIDVIISVKSIEYMNNTPWTIHIYNDDLSREIFINKEDVGIEHTINTVNNWSIGFKGEGLSTYNGIIEIKTPSYHRQIENMVFSGEIINYSLPEPIEDSQWMGEGVLNCKVEDKGNIEESKYICTVSYPLSGSEAGNNILPMTKEAVDNLKEKYETAIELWKDKNGLKAGVIIIMVICSVLVICYTFWEVYIYPNAYFKLK